MDHASDEADLAIRRQALGRPTAAPQRRRLRQEIRRAAASECFALWLQPRFSLHDGTLCGADAQVRWPHRGSIGTQAAFMPLIEECGLSDMLAGWTMKAACHAARDWGAAANSPYVALSVNGWALQKSRLVHHVTAALEETGLPPEQLDIALDDSGLAQAGEDGLLALCALADLGVRLSLDSFGAEAANLLNLRLFPVTGMKLDRSLVRDLPHDKAAATLAQCVAACAHGLGVTVVAAGVETEAQRDFLIQAGCDQAQGSLFGQLVAADNFAALLQDNLQDG
jgi:EAL domain-containing protein (putative c-di-GMP-specific phosphodiesterase class I)